MQIHQLQKSKGLKDKQRRRGRGNATGTGNYSGRGLKGQKSRSWFSMKPFFEWGQTSIVQRLPKARGFTRYYKLVQDVIIVNLGALDADARISDAMEINKQVLKDLGYIKNIKVFVKLLWHGEYAKHLTFKDIDAYSASAKVKMDKPGTKHSAPSKAPAKVKKDPKSKVGKLKIKTAAEKKVAGSKKIVEKKVVAPKAEKLIEAKVEKKSTTADKVAPKKVTEKKETVKKPAAADKLVVKKPAVKKAK